MSMLIADGQFADNLSNVNRSISYFFISVGQNEFVKIWEMKSRGDLIIESKNWNYFFLFSIQKVESELEIAKTDDPMAQSGGQLDKSTWAGRC